MVSSIPMINGLLTLMVNAHLTLVFHSQLFLIVNSWVIVMANICCLFVICVMFSVNNFARA